MLSLIRICLLATLVLLPAASVVQTTVIEDPVLQEVMKASDRHLEFLWRKGGFWHQWKVESELVRSSMCLGDPYGVVFVDRDEITRLAESNLSFQKEPGFFDQYIFPFFYEDRYLGSIKADYVNRSWNARRHALAADDIFTLWASELMDSLPRDDGFSIVLARTLGMGDYALLYRHGALTGVAPVSTYHGSGFDYTSTRGSDYEVLEVADAMDKLEAFARRVCAADGWRTAQQADPQQDATHIGLEVFECLEMPEPQKAARLLRERAEEIGWESNWAIRPIHFRKLRDPLLGVGRIHLPIGSRLVDELVRDLPSTVDDRPELPDTITCIVYPRYLHTLDFYIGLMERGALYLGNKSGALLFAIPRSQLSAIADDSEVTWIGDYKAEYKYDPASFGADGERIKVTPFTREGHRLRPYLQSEGIAPHNFTMDSVDDLARLWWIDSIVYRRGGEVVPPYPLGRPTRPPPPSDPSVPSVPLETLRATPEAVIVGDGTYGLQARWRVARVPVNAAGVLLLVRENPGQMPDEIYFRYLWVIQGDRV